MEFSTRLSFVWHSVNHLGGATVDQHRYQVWWRVRPSMHLWRRSAWSCSADGSSVVWPDDRAPSWCDVVLHWCDGSQPFEHAELQLRLVAAPRKYGWLGRVFMRRPVAFAETPMARLMSLPRHDQQVCTVGVPLRERSAVLKGRAGPFADSELWYSFRATVHKHNNGIRIL